MQISAVTKEINEWSGSVLIAGILEGTIKSQIDIFKTIIKDTLLSKKFSDFGIQPYQFNFFNWSSLF